MTPPAIPKYVEIEIGQPLIKIKVLNVPYIKQPPQMLCLPYSVWMVVEYFRRTEDIGLPELTPKDFIQILNTDPERGTLLSKSNLKKLKESLKIIDFSLERGTLERLDELFEEGTPAILIFSPMYYFYSIDEGPAHATVYLGRTETKIITNNPWTGPNHLYDLGKFLEAWEIEDFAMLTPSIERAVETKLDNFISLYDDMEE